MRRLTYTLLLAILVSCHQTEVDREISRLNALIEQTEQYRTELENKIESNKIIMLSAKDNGTKWEVSKNLFWNYYRYHLDSTLTYAWKMRSYAQTPQQILESELASIRASYLSGNRDAAIRNYYKIEKDKLSDEQKKLYLKTGIDMYRFYKMVATNDYQREHSKHNIIKLSNKFLEVDSLSHEAKIIKAQLLGHNGKDIEAKEIHKVLFTLESETNYVGKAARAYDIANIYKKIGSKKEYLEWLIKTAEYDVKAASRDYLVFYDLAWYFHEKGDLELAYKLLSINLTDALNGKYLHRTVKAGETHLILSEARKHEFDQRKQRFIYTTVGTIILLLFILGLSLKISHTNKKLKSTGKIINDMNKSLSETNNSLKLTNEQLTDANKIKDNYVFRYMEMSIGYLAKMEKDRKDFLNMLKKDSSDALMKELRNPTIMYEEYENYFKVFDETFLSIYPDFIEKLNSLLREEERIVCKHNSLPTEARIMAAIRLGVTQSGKIATFLKCSPATVYTYRTKLKNAAISKDGFEELVKSL